ncbi:MAG: hypothetical protein AAFY99_03160 [Pseudomonadota bacterium]
MGLLRITLALFGAAFAALIIWAIMVGDFWNEGAWLTSNPWGIVSLADLYLGFLLAAVVITFFEKPLVAAFWIVPIPFLGNVWVVVWFVLRLPALHKRLSIVTEP